MGSGGSKTTEASSPPKKAPPKLSEIEQGQITLMRQRDRLLKLEKTIENDIKICIEKAKAAKRNNHTDAAIRYVKLKLIKEKRRNDINAQIYNLETINLKIQEASTNADTFRAMEAGNKVIQAIQTELPIERAQQIMEDTQDALEYVDEIERVFNREIGRTTMDENALENELRLIEEMETNGSTVTTRSTPIVSSTSSSSVPMDNRNYAQEFPEVPANRTTIDTPVSSSSDTVIANRTRSKIAVAE